MLRVLWKDKIILEGSRVIEPNLLPMQLRQSQSNLSILQWLETRVFQESRLDLKELLESLDLKEYEVLAIASKTKAILTGVDHYSVEWIEEGEIEE